MISPRCGHQSARSKGPCVRPLGHGGQHKNRVSAYNRAYYEANQERELERARRYYAEHKEVRAEYQRSRRGLIAIQDWIRCQIARTKEN